MIIGVEWLGNVRELENTITRAFLLSKTNVITPADFPDKLVKAEVRELTSSQDSANPTLESIEKAYIYWVLNQTNWHKAKAAKLLGIDSSTLYRKIERYGLKREGE